MNATTAIWPCDLGEPEDPLETTLRYRAQSYLAWLETRDGSRAPLLPVEHARDVLAWAETARPTR